jgi:hypothetical protein
MNSKKLADLISPKLLRERSLYRIMRNLSQRVNVSNNLIQIGFESKHWTQNLVKLRHRLIDDSEV